MRRVSWLLEHLLDIHELIFRIPGSWLLEYLINRRELDQERLLVRRGFSV